MSKKGPFTYFLQKYTGFYQDKPSILVRDVEERAVYLLLTGIFPTDSLVGYGVFTPEQDDKTNVQPVHS